MAFIRWNENTQIWELATSPLSKSTTFNHLPIANPTLPLDIVNKQYVDAAVGGSNPFIVPNGIALGTIIFPPQLTADIDNWNPPGLSTAYLIKFNASGPVYLLGLQAQEAGRIITFFNVNVSVVTFRQNVSSNPPNGFILPNAINYSLGLYQTATFIYDGIWVMISRN